MMMNKIKGLFTQEQGQGMTEYGLVLGVIAIGVVVILAAFRDEIMNIFSNVTTEIKGAGKGPTAG